MDQGDEIDLVTGEIVVDRGHLRSMADECGGGVAGDANDFFNQMADDLEDLDEDSADELALDVPLPKPLKMRVEEVAQTVQEPQPSNVQPEPIAPEQSTRDQTEVISPDQVTMEVARIAQPLTPQQPDAAAFEALGKAIWGQLSMFMGRYGGTPATTPAVAPSTDPKWTAPPVPESASRPQLFSHANSSPLVSTVNRRQSPRRSIWALPRTRTRKPPTAASTDDESRTHLDVNAQANDARPREGGLPESSAPLAETPANSKGVEKRPRRRYIFDADDDNFLIAQREENGLTFPEIQKAREKWKEWPSIILNQRYHRVLKLGQNGHAGNIREKVDTRPKNNWDSSEGLSSHARSPRNSTAHKSDDVRVEVRIRKSRSPLPHPQQLPTPSTTNRCSEDTVPKPANSGSGADEPGIGNAADDETDYDVPEELETRNVVFNSDEPASPGIGIGSTRASTIAPDDPIESVETIGPPIDQMSPPPRIPTEVETPVQPVSTPKGKLKSIRKPNRGAANSIKKTPRNPKPLKVNNRDLVKRKTPPDSTQAVEEDNDADPIQIKEESMTPPHPLLLSTIPLRTPKSAPQLRTAHLLPSSGARSNNVTTTTIMASPASASKSVVNKHDKANYLKRVKEQWKNQAKRKAGTPVPPVRHKAVVGMGSVQGSKRKAVWMGEESEDELAM
jgi:hypothetical protein